MPTKAYRLAKEARDKANGIVPAKNTARGGLAAAKRDSEAKNGAAKTETKSTGKKRGRKPSGENPLPKESWELGRLFETSGRSVLRAADKAGATAEKIVEVFGKRGIKTSEAVVKAILAKSDKESRAAELTPEQLKEFGV